MTPTCFYQELFQSDHKKDKKGRTATGVGIRSIYYYDKLKYEYTSSVEQKVLRCPERNCASLVPGTEEREEGGLFWIVECLSGILYVPGRSYTTCTEMSFMFVMFVMFITFCASIASLLLDVEATSHNPRVISHKSQL